MSEELRQIDDLVSRLREEASLFKSESEGSENPFNAEMDDATAELMLGAAKLIEKISHQRDEARRYLSFVAKWAWRENDVLSDSERLSSIKFYPPIKNLATYAALADEEDAL